MDKNENDKQKFLNKYYKIKKSFTL